MHSLTSSLEPFIKNHLQELSSGHYSIDCKTRERRQTAQGTALGSLLPGPGPSPPGWLPPILANIHVRARFSGKPSRQAPASLRPSKLPTAPRKQFNLQVFLLTSPTPHSLNSSQLTLLGAPRQSPSPHMQLSVCCQQDPALPTHLPGRLGTAVASSATPPRRPGTHGQGPRLLRLHSATPGAVMAQQCTTSGSELLPKVHHVLPSSHLRGSCAL